MFAHSMQSQQALQHHRRDVQEAHAAGEERLRRVEAEAALELGRLRPRAAAAARELEARHEEELRRRDGALEEERRRSALLQATVDRLREEQRRRVEDSRENNREELDAARGDIDKLRRAIDMLKQQLVGREALYNESHRRLHALRFERDVELEELRAVKEDYDVLRQELDESVAAQYRLQEAVEMARSGTGTVAAAAPSSTDARSAARAKLATARSATPRSARSSRGGDAVGEPMPTTWDGDTLAATDPAAAAASWGQPPAPGGWGAAGGLAGGEGPASRGGSVWPGAGADDAGGWGLPAQEPPKRKKRDKKRGTTGPAAGPPPGSGPPLGGSLAAVDPASVAQLAGMGFSEARATEVLGQAGGDIDRAVAQLLGVEPEPAARQPSREDHGSRRSRKSKERSRVHPNANGATGDAEDPEQAAVAHLTSMGFSEQQARDALAETGGDVEEALSLLLA